jgi:hypothetical protein
MAIAGIRVNTQEAGELGAFAPLPNDKYVCLITGYEMKPQGGATTIDVTFLVAEGQFKGRKLFESICISDPLKPKRVGFGMAILKALGKVFGYPDEWTDDMLRGLLGKKVVITTEIEPERKDGEKTYRARNRLVKYEAADGIVAQGGVATPSGFAQPLPPPQPAPAPIQPQQQYAPQPQPYMSPQLQPAAAPQQYAQQPAAPQFTPPPQQQFAPPVGYTGVAPMPVQLPLQAQTGAPTWMTAAG